MLKAMRHRILTTAAFAVLALVSVEGVIDMRSWRKSITTVKDPASLFIKPGEMPSIPDKDTSELYTFTGFPSLIQDSVNCELTRRTLENQLKIDKLKTKLPEYKMVEDTGVQLSKDEKEVRRAKSHMAMYYYDKLFANGDKGGLATGIERPMSSSEAGKDSNKVKTPSDEEKKAYVAFKTEFSMEENKNLKQIESINGGGCLGETSCDNVQLVRDSAGNLFLSREPTLETQPAIKVDVTLYVPELYFKTQNSSTNEALNNTINALFQDYTPSKDDETFLERFYEGDVDAEYGGFGSWLYDFITYVRAFEEGYENQKLDETSPDAFFKDVMNNEKPYGVCRHRAYLVSYVLNKIGIKCTYARNLNHAWVEIEGKVTDKDGNKKWACVDLGGGSPLSKADRARYEKMTAAVWTPISCIETSSDISLTDDPSTPMSALLLEATEAAEAAAETKEHLFQEGDIVIVKGSKRKSVVEKHYSDLQEVAVRDPDGTLNFVPETYLQKVDEENLPNECD